MGTAGEEQWVLLILLNLSPEAPIPEQRCGMPHLITSGAYKMESNLWGISCDQKFRLNRNLCVCWELVSQKT